MSHVTPPSSSCLVSLLAFWNLRGPTRVFYANDGSLRKDDGVRVSPFLGVDDIHKLSPSTQFASFLFKMLAIPLFRHFKIWLFHPSDILDSGHSTLQTFDCTPISHHAKIISSRISPSSRGWSLHPSHFAHTHVQTDRQSHKYTHAHRRIHLLLPHCPSYWTKNQVDRTLVLMPGRPTGNLQPGTDLWKLTDDQIDLDSQIAYRPDHHRRRVVAVRLICLVVVVRPGYCLRWMPITSMMCAV